MTSRLVLVLGDLFIPDRAPVRTNLLKTPLVIFRWLIFYRTYQPKYSLTLLALHLYLLISASPVQKAPGTKQDWPNPLPRQPHRQRNL